MHLPAGLTHRVRNLRAQRDAQACRAVTIETEKGVRGNHFTADKSW